MVLKELQLNGDTSKTKKVTDEIGLLNCMYV